LGSSAAYGMTPIGSTSSNIRRAIEFMVGSSAALVAPRAGAPEKLDEGRTEN
jgi:hypothetical protein